MNAERARHLVDVQSAIEKYSSKNLSRKSLKIIKWFEKDIRKKIRQKKYVSTKLFTFLFPSDFVVGQVRDYFISDGYSFDYSSFNRFMYVSWNK